MASKASNYSKVSGFSGVITMGKEPTFDEVYGSGAAPMIVAHDKAIQRIPSPTRIAFESVLFGPSDAGGVNDAKPIPSPPPDATPTIVDEEHARLLAEAKMIRDIDTVKDFQSLVPVAHEMAVSKGWWQDGIDNRPIEEIVANYHAEVSEAWEEYRAGRMATWYAEGSKKPEGFWIEIADLLIRIADAVGAGCDLSKRGDFTLKFGHFSGDARAFITILHSRIANGCSVISLCEKFASLNKVNLYAAVREKLRYNATRPYRHGGKLA